MGILFKVKINSLINMFFRFECKSVHFCHQLYEFKHRTSLTMMLNSSKLAYWQKKPTTAGKSDKKSTA